MNIHECVSCADDVNKHGDVQVKRVGQWKSIKWKPIHFILPCKELLKQRRIVNDSDCLVCKEK
jgi:hypothetical protein